MSWFQWYKLKIWTTLVGKGNMMVYVLLEKSCDSNDCNYNSKFNISPTLTGVFKSRDFSLLKFFFTTLNNHITVLFCSSLLWLIFFSPQLYVCYNRKISFNQKKKNIFVSLVCLWWHFLKSYPVYQRSYRISYMQA